MRAQAAADEAEAAAVRDRAAREEGEVRRDGQRRLGRQRARFSASGVRLEGTPLQVLDAMAAETEAEAMDFRRAGEVRSQALLDRARSRRSASPISTGFGSLLTRPMPSPPPSRFPPISPFARPLMF